MKTLALVLLVLVAACACAPPPAPVEPQPQAEVPTVPLPPGVPQTLIEGHRIAGEKNIGLPDSALESFHRRRIRKTRAVVQVCLDQQGSPFSIFFKESTGDKDADMRIHDGIARWRYQPYVVNGEPSKVCFLVVFNYRIQ
jgi:hypothetical protein